MSETEPDKRTSVDIDLEFPVEVDGQVISKVTMRRPKVRDSFKAERTKGGDMEKGLALLSDLTEQPQEVLLEMDEIDLEKLQSQLMAFKGRTMTPESYGLPS